MNEEVLRAIVAKASSIHERLTPAFEPIDEPAQAAVIDARLQTWLMATTRGDVAAFELRLGWDGLDQARARRALGPVRLRADAPLPGWAGTLARVIERSAASPLAERCLDPSAPVPFEELLLPFVTWARLDCEQRAGAAYPAIAAAAHAMLERQLLRALSAHAALPLWLELSIELASQHGALDRFAPAQRSAESRESYDALLERLRGPGLGGFFQEYSALARVLATTTELWVEASLELLARLEADGAAIAELLGTSAALRVTAIEPALSDPHRGLRSVAVLAFSCGRRLVYKPRDLGIEAGWNALLEQLAALGAPLALRSYRVLARSGYGWTEYVERAPCLEHAQVERYFEHAGALLCLSYWLHGTDCHADNLVLAGEQPVLIDVETLLTPQTPAPSMGADAVNTARLRLTRSVLATYLLPIWASSLRGGEVFDGSGFGADPEQEQSVIVQRWVSVNSDQMQLAHVPLPASLAKSSAKGLPRRAYEHEAALLRGFAASYRFLIAARAALLAPDSAFQRLRDLLVRFVHRNTSVYSAILERLQQPELLRDGADRSLEIEPLALVAVVGEKFDLRSGWVDLWIEERTAIERGDVPHFSAIAGERTLWAGQDVRIENWFAAAGHDAAVARLGELDEHDLAFQSDLIRTALRSRIPVGDASQPTPALSSSSTTAGPPTLAGDQLWLDEARAIAASLARDAIRGADGSATWLQPAWSREKMLSAPRRELMVVGPDLYDGAAGIGLFLAAVAQLTDDLDARALALAAVLPLRIELEQHGAQTAQELGIGGLSGLGSVIYGLVQMSRLLDEPALLHAAQTAASLITPDSIDADLALDLVSGSAGAALGLLVLHEADASCGALELAMRCGQRVLARLEPTPAGARAARTLGGRFLTGFSHGAAGIAYALQRLGDASGEASFHGAARALIEFERGTFSGEQRDWPDLRTDPPRFASAWCHGAPGIALGRLSFVTSVASLNDEPGRAELDRALEITAQHEPGSADYLCCGTFGIIDILATAGRALGRRALSQRAEQLARQSITRARVAPDYALGLPSVGQLRSRGLFQGIAGVGYTLLRLAYPDQLPDALRLR